MSTQPSPAGLTADNREDIELPVWPFQDLRVASGMLLGTEDFHVMLGNPRGKMRLHQSWLHGSGVVWGLPVTLSKDSTRIEVGPGLALDGYGRELRVEHLECLTVQAWAKDWLQRHLAGSAGSATSTTGCGCGTGTPTHPNGGGTGCQTDTHHACVYVVLTAELCLDRMVPALADPCDTARKHNEASRVLETARIRIVDEAPAEWLPYPRVRALLGIDPDGTHAQDTQVIEAVRRVVAAAADRRAEVLLREMRCLAALDVTEVTPPEEVGNRRPGLFPVGPTDVPVVLARICLDLDGQGCVTLCGPIDACVRTALLPTTTIQDLLCAMAPDSIGDHPSTRAGGPRLKGKLRWNDRKDCFSFRLTAPAATGSEELAVEVSSLSERGNGWAVEGCRSIRLSKKGKRVHVQLERAPSYAHVRVIIRGTGRTPLYGRNPHEPFAGRLGGPPGTPQDGHDAVVTAYFPQLEAI